MLSFVNNFDDDFIRQFDRLRREMDEAFGTLGPLAPGIRNTPGAGFPAINIAASADHVDAYVFAAGIDPKSIDVSLQQNLLTVSGERRKDLPKGARVSLNERFEGAFSRVINLPGNVDPDKVDANYRNGLLRIRVHRREEAKPKRITVQ